MRILLAIACLWLLGGCASSRPVEIGRSVEGVAIMAEDHGRGRQRVYVIGLIHGNEPEGYAAFGEVRRVLGEHRGARVRLVPTMNPDGQTAGTRGNARGVDLNRNWPASNFTPAEDRGPTPRSEPETEAVFADLMRFNPDVLIVLHSIRRGGPFVNFDGPEPADRLSRAFVEAAAGHDPRWRVVPSMGYSTPGSLGTFAGVDLRIPTLTVEFERGHDPDEARRAVGAGLDAVLRSLAPGSHATGPSRRRHAPILAKNQGEPR
jgi:predicted deacylase